MSSSAITAPIGVNAQGEPIEEVVTSASRIRSIRWDGLLIGAAVGFVLLQLLERPRRRARR